MKSLSIHHSSDMGAVIRSSRKAIGSSQAQLAPRAGVGVRFISELERGKPTAELGKVLDTLHALGLELKVVSTETLDETTSSIALSQLTDMEFPYDWSNQKMDSRTFIRKVLQANRFHDVLRLVGYFGYQRVSSELEHIDAQFREQVIHTLGNIHKGMLLAGRNNDDTF